MDDRSCSSGCEEPTDLANGSRDHGRVRTLGEQVEGAAASLDVGPQRLGHVGGRAGGYVPGEALEGQTVDTLHRPGDGLGGRAAVVGNAAPDRHAVLPIRSEKHTSELQSLMRNSYAV